MANWAAAAAAAAAAETGEAEGDPLFLMLLRRVVEDVLLSLRLELDEGGGVRGAAAEGCTGGGGGGTAAAETEGRLTLAAEA